MTVAIAALLMLALNACADAGGSSRDAKIRTGPLRVIGSSGKGVRRNELSHYRHENGFIAGKRELSAASVSAHAYLVAWVGKDWKDACKQMSKALVARLRKIFSRASKPMHQDCVWMIGNVASGEGAIAKTSVEATEVNAESLWVQKNTGYLFFSSDNRRRQLLMRREGGAWKVDAPLPSPLR